MKQNLGINVVLDSMEAKAYQAAYKDKDYDMAFGGWGADYPDPQDWMASLFGCNASNNKYNFCDQQFDQASQKGDTGTDQSCLGPEAAHLRASPVSGEIPLRAGPRN